MNVRGAMNCATTNAFFLNVKCIVNFRFYYNLLNRDDFAEQVVYLVKENQYLHIE